MLLAGRGFQDVCACRVLLGLGWGPSGAHTHPTPWPDMLLPTLGGCGKGSQQVLRSDGCSVICWPGCEKHPFGLKNEKGLGAVAVGSRKGHHHGNSHHSPLSLPTSSSLAMTLMQWGLCFNLVGLVLGFSARCHWGWLTWAFAY